MLSRGELATALDHIERNGNLVWMDVSGYRASALFKQLERAGKIKFNPWSQRWHVVKEKQR